MAKAHRAKLAGAANFEIWGSGAPKREFLYVTDIADALIYLLQRYSGDLHLNIGTGEEISIAELARAVAATVGYSGELKFDPTKPDGAPRKLLDAARMMELGWSARTSLEEGLQTTYAWYLEHQITARTAR